MTDVVRSLPLWVGLLNIHLWLCAYSLQCGHSRVSLYVVPVINRGANFEFTGINTQSDRHVFRVVIVIFPDGYRVVFDFLTIQHEGVVQRVFLRG